MRRSPARLARPAVTAVLAVVLATAMPTPAPCQEPPASTVLGGSIDVELVNLEVYATGPDGEPVLDLEEQEFRVFEDGEPVSVTHFALVGSPDGRGREREEPPRSEDSGGTPADAQPAHVAIFLDNVHVGPASRARVLSQLYATLDQVLAPGDRVLLAAYDGTLRIELPFTDDREALRETLRRELDRGLSALQLQAGLEDRRALELIRDVRRSEALEAQGGFQGTCVNLGGIARQQAEAAYHRVQQTIGALTGFVNSLAGIPGRKILLHVSDGIPLVAGGTAYRYAIELCDGTGAAQGLPYAEDVTALGDVQRHRWDPFSARTEMASYDTTEDWQRLAAHANVHRVSFYPIQASGPGGLESLTVSGVRTSNETALFAVHNKRDSLSLIARETGGRAILDTHAVAGDVEEAVGDSRSHYLLSFEPREPGSGTVHRLRVKVDRPGVRVRHRQSYRAKGVQERIADGVLSALLHGRTDNPLGAQVEISTEGQRTPGTAVLRVRIPLEHMTLLPEGDLQRGMFTVFLALRDDQGAVTPVRHASVPVAVPAEGRSEEFVYEVGVPVPRRRTEIALALHDELGGSTSYMRREVEP